MAWRITGLHETSVPKHFTRRMRAQVYYGTYTVEQISRHEKMREELNAGKPLIAEGQAASTEDKLAFTEYCIINNPDDLRSAFEKGVFPEMYKMMRDVEEGGYSPSGRFLGMNELDGPHHEYWHFDSLITARFLEGLGILELGPGTTLCAMNHARLHSDHFVVSVEASAINLRKTYEALDGEGFVTNPLPNLRILFGDIRHMAPPEDFKADLLLANWVFWRQYDKNDPSVPRFEDVETFNAFLKWSKPDSVVRLSPPLGNTPMSHYLNDVMKSPENTGRRLFFGMK